jgi:nitrogenase molybdenum-iron protein alpha/beta subunit
MNSNPLPVNLSRLGGCTLTGALSVTSRIRDAATIVHGPKGCSHHNFSLLHATWLENDEILLPDLVSTGLSEQDIVFGGESALRQALVKAASRNVKAIFVLSTCIVETIGDDVEAVCEQEYGIPVIPVPTAGFLGGTFQDGMNNALIALAGIAEPGTRIPGNVSGVNIIGEMNLEYEVEENYAEVARLLHGLGLPVAVRFVHDIPFDRISRLGESQLNILRNPALLPVGKYLEERFGTPFIASFPHGMTDTLVFIESVARHCGIDGHGAVERERTLQAEKVAAFGDLHGAHAAFDNPWPGHEGLAAAEELAEALGLYHGDTSDVWLPVSPAVGTAGLRRMLHRWRRAIHA